MDLQSDIERRDLPEMEIRAHVGDAIQGRIAPEFAVILQLMGDEISQQLFCL
jgi:hypothetical protein